MNKIIAIIVLMMAVLCIAVAENSIPTRPSSVHPDAKWDKLFNTWHILIKEGGFIIWFKDGKVKSKEYLSKTNKYVIIEDYYINGNLLQKGQRIIDPNLREEHAGEKVEKIAVGKWKKYYESGSIKHEWCHTPEFDGIYWIPAKCEAEIFYNESGKETKRVQHKLTCNYGCEEVRE